MFRFTSSLLPVAMLFIGIAQAEQKFQGIGRAALPAEIKAWDIDVRPDFTGLPPGSGSVAKGQEVWESKCASCHGTFGESNEVFSPLVGGTTADDIKTGHVKALREPVSRTTMMKVSSVSTLWDYINRAMPWNAPKSLSTDEVYASLAYLLNLADIVPANFVLTEKSIRAVQDRLPNRNGKVKYEGLWNIRGKGDVQNAACMRACKIEIGLTSALPEFARGTHGNLAEQQRSVRSARGVDTAKSLSTSISTVDGTASTSSPRPTGAAMLDLARKSNCAACHQVDKRIVGPSYHEIAEKYKVDAGAEATLADKVRKGGSGVWGAIPMPPNEIGKEDIRTLVEWILSGAPEK